MKKSLAREEMSTGHPDIKIILLTKLEFNTNEAASIYS